MIRIFVFITVSRFCAPPCEPGIESDVSKLLRESGCSIIPWLYALTDSMVFVDVVVIDAPQNSDPPPLLTPESIKVYG